MSAQQLIRDLEDLGSTVTSENKDEVLPQLLNLVTCELNRCLELCPNGYLPLPVTMVTPDPPLVRVLWSIGAPHPFEGLDGRTERRRVRTTSPSLMQDEDGMHLSMYTGDLSFSEFEDADAFARALTLGKTATASFPTAQATRRALVEPASDEGHCGR